MTSPTPPRPTAAPTAKRSGRSRVLSFLFGWVVIPGLILAGIFGLGMHCGANTPLGVPERWVLKVADWQHDWVVPVAPPRSSTTAPAQGVLQSVETSAAETSSAAPEISAESEQVSSDSIE